MKSLLACFNTSNAFTIPVLIDKGSQLVEIKSTPINITESIAGQSDDKIML